jgi:hypothetical protein
VKGAGLQRGSNPSRKVVRPTAAPTALIDGNTATSLNLYVLSTVRAVTITAAVFPTLGTLLSVGNYLGIVRARRKHVGFSCIPILGGLFGCVGFLLLPRIRLFAFVPLVADPGCVMVLALLVRLLRKDPKASR